MVSLLFSGPWRWCPGSIGIEKLDYASNETMDKTQKVGTLHLHQSTEDSPTRIKGCPFSPLRFVWLASLIFRVHGQQPDPFPAQFELSSLDGTNGFVMEGEQAGDRSGFSVSMAGDVNGDGIGDLVIGSRYADTTGRSQAGKSYVVFGRRSFSNIVGSGGGSFELKRLNGNNGFILVGEAGGDWSGTSVSGAGDVNGDGIGDLVIGANGADPSGKSSGKSYLVFGRRSFENIVGGSGNLKLSELNGDKGFILLGEAAGDQSGRSVSSAGDMNGDGLSDIVIGAFGADPSGKSGAGKSYVVFGRRNISNIVDGGGILNLSRLRGRNGFILNGEAIGEWSGFSVASIGDVNGDGLADCAIGAHKAKYLGRSAAGKCYVVFGSLVSNNGTLELSSLNGSNGFILNGEAAEDLLGYSVSSAGDVNGDGLSDFVIGAYGATPTGRTQAGKSYVVFGSRSFSSLVGSGGAFDLSSLDGTNGFVLNGEVASDWSGESVSGVGDVNGDGIDDLVIGANSAAPSGRSFAGKCYVLFGNRDFVHLVGSDGTIELSSLNGTTGFILYGEATGDRLGDSVSGAGDVNGDGLSDLLIGAIRATPSGRTEAGKSYVVFGRNLTNISMPNNTQITLNQGMTTPSIKTVLSTHNEGPSSKILPTIKIPEHSSLPSTILIQQSLGIDNTPLIVGIVSALSVLVCSLLSGSAYFYRKKSTLSVQTIETQLNNKDSSIGTLPTTAIQREALSTQEMTANHEYGKFPPEANYDQAQSPTHLYDQVIMEDRNNKTYQVINESIRTQEHVYDSPSSPL